MKCIAFLAFSSSVLCLTPKKGFVQKDVSLALVSSSTTASPSTAGRSVSAIGSSGSSAVAVAVTSATTTTAHIAVATSIPTGSGSSGQGVTSGGSSISIIQPLTGAVLQVGQQLQITWALTGVLSSVFNNATLTFEIDNASNPNNVAVVAPLTFAKAPLVGDLMASAQIPSTIAPGSAYSVRASYKDKTDFVFWYSPSFSIQGGAPVVTGATTGSSAHTTAGPASPSSSGRSVKISGGQISFALITALFLIF
ncbi:hypothetical protein HDU98_004965 [Podochytrium sp. JEL0797]|nr:hypothetical protein HDU98_004965 [Podochytrium sp. JEL0797]